MTGDLFSSESVTCGHPDKLCDTISDAIVDACLAVDANARVAVETCVKGKEEMGLIVLAGEVSLDGSAPDYEAVARKAALKVGYDSHDIGMDAASSKWTEVQVHITTQSSNIAQGVNKDGLSQGAGDQGLMFGYACTETEAFESLKGRYFPLAAALSQRLTRRLTAVREEGILPWVGRMENLRSRWNMTKAMLCQGFIPSSSLSNTIRLSKINSVVQRSKNSPMFAAKYADMLSNMPSLRSCWIRTTRLSLTEQGDSQTQEVHTADAGLTGRKIIVDTYGGMGRHGGGAFSGKDPSKVDRSAAYAARWAAKHVVAAGIAERCEIQLAYVIGVAEPVSVRVETFGTSALADREITQRVRSTFDFRPGAIAQDLNLLRPIYSVTAAGGHFGRTPGVNGTFPWELIDEQRLNLLQN